MSEGTYKYSIFQPDELDAGIRGFSDVITVTASSGDFGGDDGEFQKYMLQAIYEWYDGARVTGLG